MSAGSAGDEQADPAVIPGHGTLLFADAAVADPERYRFQQQAEMAFRDDEPCPVCGVASGDCTGNEHEHEE